MEIIQHLWESLRKYTSKAKFLYYYYVVEFTGQNDNVGQGGLNNQAGPELGTAQVQRVLGFCSQFKHLKMWLSISKNSPTIYEF